MTSVSAWGSADGDCLIPVFFWDQYELQEICRKEMEKALAESNFIT
jgi:hypothetical protein